MTGYAEICGWMDWMGVVAFLEVLTCSLLMVPGPGLGTICAGAGDAAGSWQRRFC